MAAAAKVRVRTAAVVRVVVVRVEEVMAEGGFLVVEMAEAGMATVKAEAATGEAATGVVMEAGEKAAERGERKGAAWAERWLSR